MSRSRSTEARAEIPPGTLDLLILQCVLDAPRHGYAVAREISGRSSGTLLAEEGSLYPALHRLVRAKQLAAEWGLSENNRRARCYRITAAGRPPCAVRVTVRPVRDSMARIDEWIAAGHEATSWDGSECMVFVHDPSKDQAPGGPVLRPDDTVWVAHDEA